MDKYPFGAKKLTPAVQRKLDEWASIGATDALSYPSGRPRELYLEAMRWRHSHPGHGIPPYSPLGRRGGPRLAPEEKSRRLARRADHTRQCQAVNVEVGRALDRKRREIASGGIADPVKCKLCKCWLSASSPLWSSGSRACRPCTRLRALERHRHMQSERPEEYRLIRKLAKHRRDARLRAGGHLSAADWRRVLVAYGTACLKCGATSPPTIDHVIPISLNGRNDITNVQPLCHPCNTAKNATVADYRPFPLA